MSYVKDNFLLTTKTAEKLYKQYAENQPIFDYHCHLSERQILANAEIGDVFEAWLSGDHYKWRLMRNYGVPEEFITGNRTNKEKFVAYCSALGTAFGNPLYHWSQVELKEFFDCDLEINAMNAEAIWEQCNAFIAENALTPQKLIEKSNVTALFTTNEVFDDLTAFEKIAEKGYNFAVSPAFRADKMMNIDSPSYLDFLGKLEALTHSVTDIEGLEKALKNRLSEFKKVGARAADIALEYVPPIATREEANEVLKNRLSGVMPSETQTDKFKSYLTYYLMKLYAQNDIVTELHVGATRNNNGKMFDLLGADSGFDAISEQNSTKNLSRLMDKLNLENCLPRIILFNLNPKMNSEFMALIGCFQDGSARGKIQYGPAWWFLDNKSGMEQHLKDLTATGHIGSFVGMLTDSRSLLSYPRHKYFRRILCSYLGEMMENGLMTADLDLVGSVVRDICYQNAVKYFKL